tara:strand:- start:1042 stop:1488 length:447 start_codon:yes stop_codon:yes gene_type:complete
MVQATKEYEHLDEFDDLANKIVEKYPEIFYGVNLDEIRCVSITNKDRGEKQDKLWEVMPVKMPVRLDCKYGWYIVVYGSDWHKLIDKHKKLLVASALCAIPTGDNAEGKTKPLDYKDYAVMLRTFGVDYLDADTVPDILEEDVQWKSL